MQIPFYDYNPFKRIETPIHKDIVNIADQLNSKDLMKVIPYEQQLTRQREDIGRWSIAMNAAESIHWPNRTELYRLFKETVLDNHLSALMSTRKNGILSSRFIVTDKQGNEVKEKTDLINKKWFYDFIDMSLDSLFYGYSLIQFGDLINNEFKSVSLIPREYVKQEFHLVVPNPSSIQGTDYTESPYSDWSIGVGNQRDLGLLSKAAPIVLYKKGALTSWAIYNEIFGQPIRIGKMSKRDVKTHQSMVNFLKNMGNNPWAVIDKDDDIQLLESGKTSGQDVYDKLIERANSELSKLILGQTGTTDEKSYAGSANVHERILKEYNESDERFIRFIIQNQLLPFLNKHGFGLDNLVIDIEEDSELSLIEKSQIDLKLLEFYNIPEDYILKTYGTPVIPKIPVDDTIKNKLDGYYDIE